MPIKDASTTKDARLEIRISNAEKDLLQRAADRDDRPLSNWIRTRLVRAAEVELEGKHEKKRGGG